MKQLLTISQILLYYDLPQIMVSENAVGAKFISMLVNDDETLYLATAISSKRLASFINGYVDLRDIFVHPEIGDYYTFNYIDEDVIASSIPNEEVPTEYLPEEGYYLKKKSDDEAIIQEALEINNAVVQIAFSDKDDSNSILADQLGDLLKYYQMTIEYTYKKKNSQTKPQIRNNFSSPKNYKLRAFKFSPGSFNVHLFSTAQVDIFGSSRIDIALKTFDDLLRNNLSESELLQVLRSVKGHTIGSLKNLLQKVIDLDVKIKHKWYAPDQREVHISYIDRSKATHITEVLNSAEELSEEIKEFIGYFEQVDTEKGTWRIFNLEDQKEYSGICNDGTSLQGITVDKNVLYKLVCNEIIEEMKVTEKEKTKLVLVAVDPSTENNTQ